MNNVVRRLLAAPIILLGLIVLFGVPAYGIGSDKSDEEKAAEKQQKAVKVYNEGVLRMQEARAAAAQGDSAFAYNYRATSDAKATKAFEKAVDKFREATKLDPSMKEAFNNLGYSYRKLGKLEESLAAYTAALALDSAFAQAREYLGETYLALGQLEKAEQQHTWLTSHNSAYADSLSSAIQLYRLQEINKKMNGK